MQDNSLKQRYTMETKCHLTFSPGAIGIFTAEHSPMLNSLSTLLM